jgi:2-C-methyl-D-erythritol 4-phosphate cytidylyltransferase
VVSELAGSAAESAGPAGDADARAVLLTAGPSWSCAHPPEVGGVALVNHAVRALLGSNVVGDVLVLAPRADEGRLLDLLGAGRGASVRVSGSLPDGWAGSPDVVLVHDLLHPLTPASLVASVLAAARELGTAVVPVVPVTDTIKRLDPDGFLLDTVDRAGLRVVQAPLALPARQLAEVLAAGPASGAAIGPGSVGELVSRLPGPVHTVPGDPLAFELRSRWDLRLAESLEQT